MSLPNQLTVLRIILTPCFLATLFVEHLYFKYLSFFIFFIASLTDWYDGYVARKYGDITKTGKYLDPLADKIMISTAFGAFTFLGYVKFWMFLAITLRDLLITCLRSYAFSTNKPFITSKWAKWKTASQMFAIYYIFIWILLTYSFSDGKSSPAFLTKLESWDLMGKIMFFVTLYTVMTGLNYLYDNRVYLKNMAVAFYRVFLPTNVR
ncbi:MAG: CDP-diacylglycerol--glycerol-3-phosphate 3-phosphatidyltransferase [Calditrichaeota bacterium]|nr:MAG: CDP-diacylglycerol--glycerol-3-phosphate 3-phosphatidyltransferase [Calditrichota bacterium]